MKKVQCVVVLAFMIALLPLGGALAANQEVSTTSSVDSDAMTILMNMANFVAKAKAFSLTMVTGYDSVQENGQKIEFGDVRNIVVQRPDHIREDITQREGTKAEFIFNGKEIYVFNSRDNVYGTVKKSGTIEQAITYFTEELQMRLPLAMLFSAGLPDFLKEHVKTLYYVDTSIIEGVACDHLAARGLNVDFQVWIQQGDKPLPLRVVITYKDAGGEPQFWAQIQDWNLSPKISSSLFAIKPPEGAEKISFVALMHEKSQPGEKKGE